MMPVAVGVVSLAMAIVQSPTCGTNRVVSYKLGIGQIGRWKVGAIAVVKILKLGCRDILGVWLIKFAALHPGPILLLTTATEPPGKMFHGFAV